MIMVVTNLKKPPEFLKFHTNSRFGIINSFPLRGIWVQILWSQKNLHDFEALLSCCMSALCLKTSNVSPPILIFVGSHFYNHVSYVLNLKEKCLIPTQIQPSPIEALQFLLTFLRACTWTEYISGREKKKRRFCRNAEGKIFLTAYVPPSQRKHSVHYKSLTKPLRFDFYLSNYCQHILYISFKRLNPIFHFIKLFLAFTEFYIKSETYLN